MGSLIRLLLTFLPIILIASLVFNVLLAGLLTLTYKNLTKEVPIASVSFTKDVDDETSVYKALLIDYKGNKIGDYKIYGDQWRIDATFIKMAYLANVLGIDSKYTLDRFEGRYKDINQQNKELKISYQLENKNLVEYFSWFFDVKYGSSTYTDIKLNTNYIILKSQTGLLVRESKIEKVKEVEYFEKVKTLLKF